MGNEGKVVKVHYTGTLDDGTKFDSSYDRGKPLEFVCMAGQMIRGFDTCVRDMEVGEKKKVHLEPEEAYGQRDERAIQTIEIAHMPGSETLSLGDQVVLSNRNGHRLPAVVTDKTDTTITFDMNHELAGKPLNFEIELLEIVENPEE